MADVASATPWYRDISKGQVQGLIAAWLGYFLDGFDFALIIYVVTDIAKEFDLSLAAASSLVGASFTTRWLAGPVIGSIADKYGRRSAMIAAMCFYSFGAAGCGLAVGYWSVFLCRAIVGIGMAGEYCSSAAYVVEMAPARIRNTATALLLTFFSLGIVAAAQLYPRVVPYYGWRVFMFFGLVPVVITLYIRFFAPESAPWLESQGKVQEKTPSGLQILSSKWWPITLLLCFTVFALYMSNMPIMILLPTYLKDIGYTPAEVASITSLGGLGTGIGALLAAVAADRWGTARTMSWALSLAVLFIFPVFLIGKTAVLLLGALVLPLMMLTLGNGGIMPKWISEHYPVELRGAGVGTVYNVGAFGGFFGPTAAAFASQHFGLAYSIIGAFFTFVVGMLLIIQLDIPMRLVKRNALGGAVEPTGAIKTA